ncbi:hypothetical protein NIES4071_107090 (plasmid) [Calothrix sp. NIES-4071]|nr:hypothetical protein NIES4071_107090 [Calothrix sp. NIES-4071]BAZ64749.1 hypothetical protein NIES4105_104820 [Calothrix sp. NIES-4105]
MGQTILILAANPKGTTRVRLEEEVREIDAGLRRALHRDQFVLEQKWAVRPRDIQRAMLDINPTIVHFSGHGTGDDGLVFEDETGSASFVDSEALAGLFDLFADQVECIVLNGCYSLVQAEAISQHINYVIGMKKAIGDRAAIEFSVGFYDALAAGKSIEFAYKFGCAAIRLAGIPEQLTPTLKKKPFNRSKDQLRIPNKPASKLVKELNDQSAPQNESSSETINFDVVTVNAQGQEIKRERGQAEYFTENLSKGIALEMVAIPGGSFKMSSPKDELERSKSESPQHLVKIEQFSMGKYPVTQAQWKAVAALPQVNRKLDPDPSRFKGANRPVEEVSWYDAVEFCERLTAHTKRQYRLPSEAEWEYACRARTSTPFHFGETITSELANYNACSTYGAGVKGIYRGETTEVGSFTVANAFGLYDMHGNVWEWCLDDWHTNYQGAPTDGSPWFDDNNNISEKQGRVVLRGGSWYNYPLHCRSASRNVFEGTERNDVHKEFGFRVVCKVGNL